MLVASLTLPESPRWFLALAEEPALVVLLLAGVGALITGAVLLRLRRAVRQARARGALEDWLLGAEEAMSGQLSSARERLQRVVAQDPENHGARILLAETLLDLNEPTAAHGHFVALTAAFAVASRRVEQGLVRALVDSGRVADAADRLRAQPRAADDVAALRQRLAVELAAGLPMDAAQTGQRLLARAQSPQDLAAARLAASRVPSPGVTKRSGASAPRYAITVAPQGPRAAHVAHAQGSVAAAPRTAAEHALQQLVAEAAATPYLCASCRVALERSLARCPHCDSRNTARLREPGLQRALASVSAAADEIEENDAHVQRLLERTLTGDADARRALIEAGAAAVGIVFARAVAYAVERASLTEILQAMGSGALSALFDAYERTRRGAGTGVAAAAPDIVGRVVQAYGPSALPAFEARLDTDDHDLRKIVVDYYLGLDDVEELQSVLERYPPVEVIQRLNATPAPRLQAWLTRVPERGLLAEVVLVNQMFLRDEDMLLAAAQAPSPEPLLTILLRRGASHDLATFAVDRLHDDDVAPVAERVLRQYGVAAADALLAGYLDLDRAPAARARARGLLVALGAGVVPQVCQCFGASPARLDDELVAVLVALGGQAVDPLGEAYRRRNLLERVGGRLVRRYNHPRNAIVKVLARIGGAVAQAALLALRAEESDANLKLRLDQALQVAARALSLPPAAGAESDAARGDTPRQDTTPQVRREDVG